MNKFLTKIKVYKRFELIDLAISFAVTRENKL